MKKLMQNYAEKRPIPNNPGNSSSTCCDGVKDMRQDQFTAYILVAKQKRMRTITVGIQY